ncbi:hypothetical protein HPP92_008433 [Vanilla planifolia]|uniref:Uncharacterized protein n=1 Tax=Vanilla planifolia TaxID=51239 RepID=A0A835R4Q1_VANPL|nr:hypothetical protein HPP92_008433 [Vanilla planifolia]
MRSGTVLPLLLLMMLLCCVASTRMETAKKESFIDVGVRRSILGYPGNSVENHHAIPRTQFGSQTPPGEDDPGNGGNDTKN